MAVTSNEKSFKSGDTIGFCPDIDRSAQFSIEEIKNEANEKVTVFLKYIKGAWQPFDPEKIYELTVPNDFSTEDIHAAWLGFPNLERFLN